jgi:hypothetical protein
MLCAYNLRFTPEHPTQIDASALGAAALPGHCDMGNSSLLTRRALDWLDEQFAYVPVISAKSTTDHRRFFSVLSSETVRTAELSLPSTLKLVMTRNVANVTMDSTIAVS